MYKYLGNIVDGWIVIEKMNAQLLPSIICSKFRFASCFVVRRSFAWHHRCCRLNDWSVGVSSPRRGPLWSLTSQLLVCTLLFDMPSGNVKTHAYPYEYPNDPYISEHRSGFNLQFVPNN